MGIFKKKTKQVIQNDTVSENSELKDDISKAYDELTAGGNNEHAEVKDEVKAERPLNLEMELLKSKIDEFKDKKSQESLFDVLKLLPGKEFLLPSVSNVKEPFENVDGKMQLKKGAVLNPALLTAPDKKIFLPIFTDEKSMTQKSPSGIVLRFRFEQCIEIVMNKDNPVGAMVINPFSENMILGEDLLKMAFKKTEKN